MYLGHTFKISLSSLCCHQGWFDRLDSCWLWFSWLSSCMGTMH